jgi:hypothetical protein
LVFYIGTVCVIIKINYRYTFVKSEGYSLGGKTRLWHDKCHNIIQVTSAAEQRQLAGKSPVAPLSADGIKQG